MRARLPLILLCAAVLLAGGTAVYAAATKPAIGLSATPTTQTVAPGSTASYALAITPSGGLTGTVSLTVAGLPAGTSARFAPSAVSVTDAATATDVLELTTSRTTPAGTYPLVVTAASGKLSSTTAVTLVVRAGQQEDFALDATPVTQTILAGDATTYGISLSRSGGFSGPVALTAASLPAQVTATFSPSTLSGSQTTSTLTVTTAPHVRPDAYPIAVVGTGGGRTRFAAISLTVAPTPTFTIAGTAGALYPGASSPLDLAITNPLKQPLVVTSLTVGVKDDTGNPGCVGSRNYAVTPFAGSYPITVPAGATRRLSELGYASSQWPRVRMLDLPVNQDACKGATVTLSYAGSATK